MTPPRKPTPEKRASARRRIARVNAKWLGQSEQREVWLAATRFDPKALEATPLGRESWGLRHRFCAATGRASKGADGWWVVTFTHLTNTGLTVEFVDRLTSKWAALGAFDTSCKNRVRMSR